MSARSDTIAILEEGARLVNALDAAYTKVAKATEESEAAQEALTEHVRLHLGDACAYPDDADEARCAVRETLADYALQLCRRGGGGLA